MKLHDLMAKHGSDKATHGFCDFYESFFGSVREDIRSVLEIGVADGASIRGWLDYFPNARIVGLDAVSDLEGRYGDHANWPMSPRFLPFVGDQASRTQLDIIVAQQGPWDIVIDDGGHTMEQQQVSLGVLFPHTTRLYVVEDLHTSFMDEITIYDPNGPKRSYPTGILDGPTTHELLISLSKWGEVGGDHITAREAAILKNALPQVHIFDRDGDHKHMTSVLEVKNAE